MRRSPIYTSLAFALGLGLALILLWLLGQPPMTAQAAPLRTDIVVTTTIQAAIDAAQPGDRIIIPAGVFTENLVITKSLTLLGAGETSTIVDGNNAGRVLSTTSDVSIADLTIQNGLFGSTGGGIYAGGALTLTHVAVLSNTATNSGGGAYANKAATLTGGRFANNRCTAAACSGGGLRVTNAVVVIGTAFISNSAGSSGGGLRADSTLTLTGTQFVNNTATNGGGAYHNAGVGRVVNALFAGNSASSNGAALYLNSSSNVRILHATIASPTDGAGTAILIAAGTVGITNTIVASYTIGISNAGGTVYQDYNLFYPTTSISGVVASGEHSTVGDPAFANPAGDDYHLTSASAAMDRGINAGIRLDLDNAPRPGPFTSLYDVGAFEAQNVPANCFAQIGAGTTFTSSNASAVQAAVDAANAGDTVKVAGYCAGAWTRAGTAQTVLISKTLTMQGGYTATDWSTPNPAAYPTVLDALGGGRVIYIASGDASISGLTIQNGYGAGSGGGIYASGSLTLTDSGVLSNTANGDGGGAYVALTATLTGGRFENNQCSSLATYKGGGLRLGGNLTLSGTTFLSNTSGWGGGAWVALTATLIGGRFENNHSITDSGGGLRVGGNLTLTDTQFLSNTARRYGGGAFVVGNATLNASRFEGNQSTDTDGGGLDVSGNARITGGRFSNNRCTGTSCLGGGVFVYNSLVLTGTQFINNAAQYYGGGVYIYGNGTNSSRVVNALFARNSAGISGAGLSLFDPGCSGSCRVDILHATVTSPTVGAGAGIYVYGAGTASIKNSIVASYTTGIRRSNGTASEDYNLFYRTTPTDTVSSGGHSLVGLDPAFVNPGADDYRLTADSAAIDKGMNAGVYTDLEGNSRPQGDGFDIGAYESPFTAHANLEIGKSVKPAVARPGQSVTYTLTYANNGPNPAFGVIITDIVPISVTSVSYQSKGAVITPIGSISYTWQVENLAPGAGGIITITGIVSPGLSGLPATFTNTAAITSTTLETITANNDAFAAITASACFATPNDGNALYATVQEAVDAAAPGDTVKVAGYCAGAWTRAGTVQTVLITKTLTMQGGYTTTNWTDPYPITQPTTLDAQGSGRVVYATADISISGLTVQNGNVSGSGATCPDAGCGAGIYAEGALTLTNVTVLSNTAQWNGGGTYADHTLTMVGTQFISNTTQKDGGGAYARSHATLLGGRFENNRCEGMGCWGGGLSAWSTLTLSGGTQFINNTAQADGGGVYADGAATLSGGRFENNRAQYGGGLSAWSTLILTGTQFISNTAQRDGGGVYVYGGFVAGNSRVVNTLFARNSAGGSGAALYLFNASGSSSSAEVLHTTIASPTVGAGQAIYVGSGAVGITDTIIASYTTGIDGASATVYEDYNLFDGVTTPTSTVASGGHSFFGNPAFADPASDDYHLTPSSAAVDTGVDAGIYTDLEGQVRPQGDGFDIGCDESPYTGQANLSIVKIADPEPAIAGRPLTYTIIITNNGALPAANVTLSDTLSLSTTLLLLDQTDDSAGEFYSGTFDNAAWHQRKPGSRWLAISDTTLLSGTFTSRIMDGLSPVTWSALEWEPLAPYGKELPNNGQAETDYARGRADMTGNLILLHLNEPAGSSIFSNTSGVGNDATCAACPTAGVPGRFNTALSFDGANDSLVITDTFNPTEYAIEAWVNLTSTADSNIILRTDLTGTVASHWLGIQDGRFAHVLNDGITRTITGTTPVATGTWYYVAGVATSNGILRLYVNGVQEASASGLGSPWAGGDRYLLGAPFAGAGYLDGVMDQVAVYSRTLAPAEVSDHYKRGALRLAFQARSCDDPACAGETFAGPDSTPATYYSELLNTTLGRPSLAIAAPSNRYFQYKAFLYTDHPSYSPELREVRVLPDHRDIAPSQGSCAAPDPSSFTCDLGTLPGGGAATIIARAQVDPWALGVITNTATVSATNALSTTVEAASTVIAQADLHIHKHDDPDPVNPGSVLTYMFDVYNDGPSTARDITVTDSLPINVMGVIAPDWSCAQDANTITCTRPSLVRWHWEWDTIVVTGAAPMISGTMVNTAWITSTTPETDPTDNVYTQTTRVIPLADLDIDKGASPDPVDPGATLTWTLVITNNGPYTATNVVVNDWLPESVVWGGGPATCSQASGVVTCTIPNLDPLASQTINLTVTVPLTGFLTNAAAVRSDIYDPDKSDNWTFAYAAVRPVADLDIVKSDHPDPVYAGAPLTYTLTFSDAGPSAAGTLTTTVTFSNPYGIGIPSEGKAWPYPSVIRVSSMAGSLRNVVVTLTDLHHHFPSDISILLVGPSGQSVVLMSSAGGYDAATAALTFDDAAAAALPLTETLASGIYRPTNYGLGGDLPLPAPPGPYGGNLAVLQGASPNGDWKLYVTDWAEEDDGDIDSWSLQLTTVADGDITVTDELPAGMTSDSITAPAEWTCQPGSVVTCVAPRLETSAPANIVIAATAPITGGVITNTAAITSTTADLNLANNMVAITTTVLAVADLQIAKSDSPDPVGAGRLLTYTLAFTNAGPSPLANVTIIDILPVSAIVVSAPGCTPASNVLTCTVAGLAVNIPGSLIITVLAPPDAGAITNTTTITSTAVDLYPLNNTAWVTTTVTAIADLSISKADAPDPVWPGGLITYTIVVTNNGPSVATNAVFTERVPVHTTFQNIGPTVGWNCATPPVGGTGDIICTRASLPVGAPFFFTIVVRVNPTAPNGTVIVNTATVASSTADPTTPSTATALTWVGITKLYLPIVSYNYAFAPDLIVQSIVVTSAGTQVVIKNQGPAPVTQIYTHEFWVDVYINPATPPTRVNQTRETLNCQGAVWGVTMDALPQLVPGGMLTLTIGGQYYWPSKSNMPASIPAGTRIYAQVDSASTLTTWGAVLENHEIIGGTYNNITSTLSVALLGVDASADQPPIVEDRPPDSPGGLPPGP